MCHEKLVTLVNTLEFSHSLLKAWSQNGAWQVSENLISQALILSLLEAGDACRSGSRQINL